jgi:nitroreductase
MMDVGVAIRERRSIRKYKPGEIPQKDLDLILEAAMMAPSARNSRPWKFTVVRNRSKRESLSQITPYVRMAEQASCAIVISGVPSLSEFWQQDCGASVENILLEAKGLGYGTCWCGLYPNMESVERVKKLLDIKDSEPMAIIVLGVPDESPSPRGHYEPGRVRYFD